MLWQHNLFYYSTRRSLYSSSKVLVRPKATEPLPLTTQIIQNFNTSLSVSQSRDRVMTLFKKNWAHRPPWRMRGHRGKWEKTSHSDYLLWEDDSHERWCIAWLAHSLREIGILWCQFWRPVEKQVQNQDSPGYELVFAIIQVIFLLIALQETATGSNCKHRPLFICCVMASHKNNKGER